MAVTKSVGLHKPQKRITEYSLSLGQSWGLRMPRRLCSQRIGSASREARGSLRWIERKRNWLGHEYTFSPNKLWCTPSVNNSMLNHFGSWNQRAQEVNCPFATLPCYFCHYPLLQRTCSDIGCWVLHPASLKAQIHIVVCPYYANMKLLKWFCF